jgi:hypothetical protein
MDKNQERKAINLKEMEADGKSDHEQMLAEISIRMDANATEINATQERMNANLKDLKGDIKSSQAEMRSTVYVMRFELKETIRHEMKAVMKSIWSKLDEMTACNDATENELDPGMMQSIEEHQVPNEEAAVMLVRKLRKWHRVQNVAVERHQKRKERTWGKIGSRRKSAATCRKVSRHAKVARQKRKLVRRIGTQENCGP